MAVFRDNIKCPFCNEIVAKPIYKTTTEHFIGDSFLRWEFIEHECKNNPNQQKPNQDNTVSNLNQR